ncbi:MAG: DUF2007 domain-containing protein [Pseudomonadota bacterium]
MRELVQTNNPVLLSFLEVLLRDQGIEPVVFDVNMSILEGSVGVLPKRLLVPDDDWHRARKALVEADLGQWLSDRDVREE